MSEIDWIKERIQTLENSRQELLDLVALQRRAATANAEAFDFAINAIQAQLMVAMSAITSLLPGAPQVVKDAVAAGLSVQWETMPADTPKAFRETFRLTAASLFPELDLPDHE